MITLKGKYNEAKVFTDNIDNTTVSQIIEFCNLDFIKESKIRIMPDTHAGKDCTIGTTMTIHDKVVPNFVGGDIGCGMYCVKLKEKEVDYSKLDNIIRTYIPVDSHMKAENNPFLKKVELEKLRCIKYLNMEKALVQFSSTGRGNHFIELNKDDEGNIYLVIHSGSRNLGSQVAKYYQNLGYEKLTNNSCLKDEIIRKLKAEHREKEIQSELQKVQKVKLSKNIAYVEGEDLKNYLHDMHITQEYAKYNRIAIANIILKHMDLHEEESFTTIHNYIDIDNMILRKGAISAQLNEKVIIPLNMRDGSLICIGKGNQDWNYSAPHGAGRLYSRSRANSELLLEDYKESMEGIWTTSVNESTLDECPMAYKPMEEIIENIQDTVHIIKRIIPIYNYKAN